MHITFKPEVFNWEHFKTALDCQTRYLILYGGAGSGKSEIAAQKLLYRSLQRKHRFVFARKTREAIRDSQYKTFKDVVSRWGLNKLFRFNDTRLDFVCTNGSEFLSYGLDDPEKLKSIKDPTGFWIEEATETEEDDIRQVNLRMRGNVSDYFQIILTFNPKDAEHWIRKRFFNEVREKQRPELHNNLVIV